MAPLKAAADLRHRHQRAVAARSAPPARRALRRGRGPGLSIAVVSFAYRHGLPREADLVFDVRFLHNPHYVDALRPDTGRDPAVQEHIRADPGFAAVRRPGSQALLLPLLPRYQTRRARAT